MKRMLLWWLLITLGTRDAAADDAKALINKAYQKTSSASAVADYDEIIQLCQEARKTGVSAAEESYVKSLLSWAHNRRGELFTENASGANQGGEKERASELDGKALADFETAIELDPGRWKPWHNRGVSRAIAGKYQEAVSDFTKVIDLNPEYANAWFNRGEIRFDLGRFEEAVADYGESLRLSPDDVDAYTSRGEAYARLGKTNEALADYDEAIRIKPSPEALASRGDLFQSSGKWREAAEDYRQAIQLDANSSRVLLGAAWLMATCPDVAIRNADLAVEAAEKGIRLRVTADARSLDILAAAYANAGRWEDAEAKVREALAAAPDADAPAIKNRREIYRRKQPYRQESGGKTANTVSTIKSR